MTEWTIRQCAALEGVTERTVRTWIAKGAIAARRTPGGQVRIVPYRGDGADRASEDRGRSRKIAEDSPTTE